jgi:hypothetical protein
MQGQRLFVSIKALNHCRKKGLWPQPLEPQPVPCLIGQQRQEHRLRSAIPLPERVDRVQHSQKMCRFCSKSIGAQISEVILAGQLKKQCAHLIAYMLRIAECSAAFTDAYATIAACPGVNVSKQMPMNGPVMLCAQTSFW